MTLWLLLLLVVIAVAIGIFKWRARISQVRRIQALEKQRKLATERLEKAIISTSRNDAPKAMAATPQSETTRKNA